MNKMSEIEKLYENAGVEKEERYSLNCEYYEKYPPFTATKQLELIKWLAKSKSDITICYSNATERFAISKRGGYCVSENFATALAIKINLLWQDLTDAERKQIKEILE
jgi:hypothetical protein